MTKEERRDAFLAELQELCRRYNACIESDDMCGIYNHEGAVLEMDDDRWTHLRVYGDSCTFYHWTESPE